MIEVVVGAIVTLVSVGFGASLTGLKKGEKSDGAS